MEVDEEGYAEIGNQAPSGSTENNQTYTPLSHSGDSIHIYVHVPNSTESNTENETSSDPTEGNNGNATSSDPIESKNGNETPSGTQFLSHVKSNFS